MAPQVGIIMGSDSDWPTMEAAAVALAEFDVPFEVGVVSAHRTVQKMIDYARSAAGRGLRVIVTGAGGAAHLPGMVASMTPLPVIGVPAALRDRMAAFQADLEAQVEKKDAALRATLGQD